MRLLVTTPSSVVVDEDDILAVRAEDSSGAFGILPGHADFVTVLAVSVLAWRGADGKERFVAVRGGVLDVTGGRHVEVATREAVRGEDLERLETEVVAAFNRTRETEIAGRAEEAKLQVAAIRGMYRWIRPGRAEGGPPPGPPPEAQT